MLDLPPSWSPILIDDEAECARRAIRAVAAGLPHFRASQTDPDPTLTDGLAGDALLSAHLARAGFDGPWRDRAETELAAAVDRLGEIPMSAGLYTGFAGVAWAVERLHGLLGASESYEDANGDIDDALLQHLDASPWTGHYDLIAGLVGIGVYALERLARPRGRDLLALVVARLGELACAEPTGLAWSTPPHQLPDWQRELAPHGHRNLGLAHGIPGIVALLGHAAHHEIAGARPLLDGAVAWLLAQERPVGRSRFPRDIPLEIEPQPHEARVAWCYGDLGLSIALLGAARRAGRADWEAEALRIARHAAARPLDSAGARDANLCHGAAGNAHLFNRLYQATDDDRFRVAARAWFERLFTHARPDHPLGGFQTWNFTPPDAVEWKDAAGLLEGSGGVALALLAAIDPHEPAWDRFLLADL